MGFITKLDYSDNRQIRQRVETQTQLSGGTTFGVPYTELVRGVDDSTTGVTSTSSGVTSTFSGNTGTTIFFFGDTRMELAGADLEPITPSNSGDTQNAGVTYTGDTTTIVNNNQVFLTYTGIGYNLIVTNFEEVSAGNYTGETTSDLTFYSGNTADYTGSTVWLTSEDSARVKGVLYANVLSATTIVGTTISGVTDNFTTGSTLVGSTAYFNRTDSLSAYTLDLSSLVVNDNFTTGSTLVGNTLYFNRTDSLSAYTADLSSLGGVSYGVCAVYNSGGTPTYYSDLSAAITAASAGDTVQIYSDITETGAVTITCKNGVNINFNGFTYTLNNAGTDNAFSVPAGVSMEMFNGKVLRSGGTGSVSNSLAIHTTGAGTFKANNMVFESDFGTAGHVGNSARSFYGGVFYSSDRGFYLSNGNLYNAICNGGTNAGLQIQNNGKAYSCEGYSSSSYGIFNNTSNAYFCVGRSDGNYGFWGAGGNSHDCKGYSTANIGTYISASGSFSNIYGFSSSSYGVRILGNGVGVIGYSTASQGVYYSNGGGSSHVIQDVKASSTAAAGMYILLNAGKVEFSNLDVGSRWNDVSGHGIIVSGSDNDIILNGGSIRVENASANCLYNNVAKSCYFNNLSFVNSTTAVNANITNLQTNTSDDYGNILVG